MLQNQSTGSNVTGSVVTSNFTERVVKTLPDFFPCHIHLYARVIFVTVGILMVVCGVVGNCLFLKIIYKTFRQKKTIHILYLANLSLVDLLTLGYWYMFFVFDLILNRHPVVNYSHCKINGVFIIALYIASILFLVTITVNRYLYVCHNHLYRRIFTLHRTVAWCLMVWLTGFCIALLPEIDGIDSTEYRYNPSTRFCSYNRTGFTYMKAIITAWAFFPVLFLGYCNFAIFHYWRQARNSKSVSENTKKNKVQRVFARLGNCRTGVKIDTLENKIEDLTRPPETKETLDVRTFTVTESTNCTDRNKGTGNDSRIRKTCGHSRESDDKKASEMTSVGDCLSFSTVTAGTEENKTPHRLDSYTSKDSEGKAEKKIIVKHVSLENKDSRVDNQGIETPLRSQSRTSRKSKKGEESNVKQVNLQSTTENSFIDDKGIAGCPEAEYLQLQLQAVEKSKDEHPSEPPGDVPVGALLPPAMTKPTESPPGSPWASSHSRNQKELDGNQPPKPTTRERAFVRSLFAVCLTTMFTHIPYNAMSLLGTYFSLSPEITIMGNLFLFFHNSVNWILYGVMNPGFRHEYIQFAHRFFRCCH